jgi:hypothetical protein
MIRIVAVSLAILYVITIASDHIGTILARPF